MISLRVKTDSPWNSTNLSMTWRPITLLNVDLKIAAKAIAKRLETLLPNFIHPDQTNL